MNEVELLGGRVAALSRRLDEHERRLASIEAGGGLVAQWRDQGEEATALAKRLGLPGSLFWEVSKSDERKRLAAELRRRHWTEGQIAKVLGVSTRTVQRYGGVSRQGAGVKLTGQRPKADKGG